MVGANETDSEPRRDAAGSFDLRIVVHASDVPNNHVRAPFSHPSFLNLCVEGGGPFLPKLSDL